MFDGSLTGPPALAQASNRELIDAIAGWSSAAAAAEARKFAALAEWRGRTADSDPQRQKWACDPVDDAAAQVACALNVSHGRALTLMDTGVLLRDKLPRLNNRFLAGQVSERVVARIVWLCGLVVDDQVWAGLDEQFAAAAASWGVLSGDKLDAAITVWLHTLDPDAVRQARDQHRNRDFRVGRRDDVTSTTSVFGRVNSIDAAIAARRLKAMVNSVCPDDPRTLAQKRADAFGAVFAGAFHLSCQCGRPECLAATVPDARATSVVVHVVADQASLEAAPESPAEHVSTATSPVSTELRPTPPLPAEPDPDPRPERAPTTGRAATASAPRPAVILGLRGAVLPPALLAEVIARGAKVRTVADPGDLPVNPGYRPTTAQDEFVRCRDLTCRVPGCDRPAIDIDLDHSEPWPAGQTHPDNLNAKCRLHHLLKTFWEGWREQQCPDGTLTITTPTGQVYTTKPFSALLFPSWITTGRSDAAPPPPAPAAPPPSPGRGLMMPLRQRTRAQNRAAYIVRARTHNAIARELDRAAAEKAAQERRARREAIPHNPRDPGWHARQEAVDAIRSSVNRPIVYGRSDDPPPF
ncbi:HNH endonuclease [Mycolicibacterium sp. 3033]|nr:HNH endonuclease [Mycolicibacterium aurantiacum]